MKKKVISVLLVTAMTAAMLAGCGSSDGGSDKGGGDAAKTDGSDSADKGGMLQQITVLDLVSLRKFRLRCGAQKKTRRCCRK